MREESRRSKRFAKPLRRSATDAENKLWFRLRDRRLSGFKFRRQHPVGPYIVDFICLEGGLVVELDGSQHMDQVQYDEKRTKFLKSRGLQVLRFWDNEVLNETEAVLEAIDAALRPATLPSPRPSPASGRG